MLFEISLSCTHASGVTALLKDAHPNWRPVVIRYAMVTKVNPLDNTQNFIRDIDDGFKTANPSVMGAGYIDPNHALNPSATP